MVEDRVQINKEVLLDLCCFARKSFIYSPNGNFHHIAYGFENTIVKYNIYVTNNILIRYGKTQIQSFYDELSKEYYLSREDYVKFITFLDKIGTIIHIYPTWNKTIEYLNELFGTPMVKASR